MSATDRTRPGADHSVNMVRTALVRFAVWSVVALLVLSVGIALASRQVARADALREAKTRAEALSSNTVAPLVNARVRARDPLATAPLAAVLEVPLEDGSIRHIKLWSADGRVIWSDQQSIVGGRFDLPADVAELFGTTEVTAEVSTLDKPENVGERAEGELLEVYAGAFDAEGEPVVFEAYLPTTRIARDEQAIFWTVLPIAIGALLLFQLAVLPLALSLARRVQRAEEERSRTVRHALLASELERRRIAQQLHDGVVQDLAGVGLALPTLSSSFVDGEVGALARGNLDHLTGIVQRDVAALRTMMIDVYPPDLSRTSLVSAVTDLAERSSVHGVEVTVRAELTTLLTTDGATLAYRVVREGLHNVVKHAAATRAKVELLEDGRTVVVRVSDNGHGPIRGDPADAGHLGLELLEQAVTDAGGEVALLDNPEGGATLTATLPVDGRRG